MTSESRDELTLPGAGAAREAVSALLEVPQGEDHEEAWRCGVSPHSHSSMHYIDTEHPSSHPATDPTYDESEDTQQCDFCGESVRRETAVARPGGDGGEPVVLCTKCEFGID